MIFQLRDRFDQPKGAVRALSASHEAGTDGTDVLKITTPDDLVKRDRVLWKDPDTGDYHEHEVSDTKRTHDDAGFPITTANLINSICELYDYRPVDVDEAALSNAVPAVTTGTITEIMESALSETRWTWGGAGGYGEAITGTYSIDIDNDSVRTFLTKVLDAVGGEMRTGIQADITGVTTRTIYIYKKPLPTDETATPVERFVYSKNLLGVSREEGSAEIYTRVDAIGAAIKDESGETEDYVTVTVIDQSATQMWGRPGPGGSLVPPLTIYKDSNIDDEDELRARATAYLAEVSQPEVTYTASLGIITRARLGDYVDVVDTAFEPALRLRGRVNKITRDLNRALNTGEMSSGGGSGSSSSTATAATGTVTVGTRQTDFEDAIAKAATASALSSSVGDNADAVGQHELDLKALDSDVDGLGKTAADHEQRIEDLEEGGESVYPGKELRFIEWVVRDGQYQDMAFAAPSATTPPSFAYKKVYTNMYLRDLAAAMQVPNYQVEYNDIAILSIEPVVDSPNVLVINSCKAVHELTQTLGYNRYVITTVITNVGNYATQGDMLYVVRGVYVGDNAEWLQNHPARSAPYQYNVTINNS